MSNVEMNLDRVAAMHAQEMVAVIGTGKVKSSDADNLFTKALGVLQGHGLYAMALYLLYRSGDRVGPTIESAEEQVATWTMAQIWQMLSDEALTELSIAPAHTISRQDLNRRENKDTILAHFSNVLCADDLGRMLFVKRIFEQTLIYARYHARAMPKEEQGQ